MIWACPLCQKPLKSREGGVSCDSNHQFDRAKQGYLPLLPAHHKRSAAPGDDKLMLQGRRSFLQAGYYSPLADLISDRLLDLGASRGSITLLDSGCGEGYYLGRLAQYANDTSLDLGLFGIDISKDAAKLSAKSVSTASIAVASSFQLPVLSSNVDVLLRIFSPGDLSEVARVLKSDGQFWRVVPGPRHLYELKQSLYDEVKLHELPPTPEGFVEVDSTNLEFPIELNSRESIEQLLQMTPFVWHGSDAGKEKLKGLDRFTLSAEFVLQRYTKVAE